MEDKRGIIRRVYELFSLYGLYAGMDLRWFLQDRFTCIVVILSEMIGNISAVAGVFLLSQRFAGVGGLSADEVLFMLGFFQLANGFINMMFGSCNCLHISRRVGRGQVDHMLIQPRPLMMQLLAEGFMPFTGSSGFIIGIIMTCVACVRLELCVDAGWIGLFLLYVICHAAILAGQSFLYGALAFWRPVACEELSMMVLDMNSLLGKYPLAGITRCLKGILVSVLPTGLLAYVPSLVLLGKLDRGAQWALPVAVGAAFVAGATYVFRKGLAHYFENSCNRYRDMGHRN